MPNGNVLESITVELLLNDTVQTSQTVNLAAGTVQEVVLGIATQNLAKGNCTLVIRALQVQGETNTNDNETVDGTIQIRFPGDVNADGTVDILDAALVAFYFGHVDP